MPEGDNLFRTATVLRETLGGKRVVAARGRPGGAQLVRVVGSQIERVESQGKIKVTIVRPTGVLGTGLASGVVNPAASIGITGQNAAQYMDRVMAFLSGSLDEPLADVDTTAYWAITPDVVAREVVHAIDQPWGVSISDITVRASGDLYVI